MSLIKPFSGIRPKKKFAKQITSPNLSYINNYKLNKKLNFLNLLNTSNINKSKKMLKSLNDKGIIKQDRSNHFYLYRITYSKKKLLGIVGKINLDNYDDKKILGHEETFVERIKKRKEQLLKFNSQISPIYTAYKSNLNSIKKLNNYFRDSLVLELYWENTIEFKFNDEIVEENQIKNIAVNTDTLKKSKLKKSNRGFAKILTGVSVLLIFSGLLISGYAFNEMYLTNSKQESAQEKLAATIRGLQAQGRTRASERAGLTVGLLLQDQERQSANLRESINQALNSATRQYSRNVQGLEAQRDNRQNQLQSNINQAYNQVPSLGSTLLNVATEGLTSYQGLIG